ncbi:MAG: tetratricopeptide repeat protein [Phycisphaerales bacterium]|nr:MAG: tetratricopeptide repeat protein [Phycisphaerales bacterium]
MLRNGKATALTVAGLFMAGCAQSDYVTSRNDRARWHRVEDKAIANAREAVSPKILPETYYAAAQLFEAQGLLGKAIVQYRKAVLVNRDYADAYHHLGILLGKVGKHDEATAALERAAELRPDDPVLANNVGFELMLQERWADAEYELQRAIQLRPYFPRAYVNLGIVLCKLDRFGEGLMSFQEVLPEADAYYNLGLLLRGQKCYEEAVDAFKHTLSLDRNFKAASAQLEQLAQHPEPVAPEQFAFRDTHIPRGQDGARQYKLIQREGILADRRPEYLWQGRTIVGISEALRGRSQADLEEPRSTGPVGRRSQGESTPTIGQDLNEGMDAETWATTFDFIDLFDDPAYLPCEDEILEAQILADQVAAQTSAYAIDVFQTDFLARDAPVFESSFDLFSILDGQLSLFDEDLSERPVMSETIIAEEPAEDLTAPPGVETRSPVETQSTEDDTRPAENEADDNKPRVDATPTDTPGTAVVQTMVFAEPADDLTVPPGVEIRFPTEPGAQPPRTEPLVATTTPTDDSRRTMSAKIHTPSARHRAIHPDVTLQSLERDLMYIREEIDCWEETIAEQHEAKRANQATDMGDPYSFIPASDLEPDLYPPAPPVPPIHITAVPARAKGTRTDRPTSIAAMEPPEVPVVAVNKPIDMNGVIPIQTDAQPVLPEMTTVMVMRPVPPSKIERTRPFLVSETWKEPAQAPAKTGEDFDVAQEVINDVTSTWDEIFGDVQDLFSIVRNEMECWEAYDAEQAIMDDSSKDDGFEPW